MVVADRSIDEADVHVYFRRLCDLLPYNISFSVTALSCIAARDEPGTAARHSQSPPYRMPSGLRPTLLVLPVALQFSDLR